MSSKKYIICVDDEKILLESLKNDLKSFFQNEYYIEIAESGAEALEIIQEIKENNGEISLIISDYLMPAMKGDEFLVQAKAILPTAYRVMLTGQATMEGITNAINNGGLYRYIAKPWEYNDLSLTMNEALKSYNQERHIEKQIEEIKLQNQEIRHKNEEILEINANLDKLVEIRTKELKDTIQELLKVTLSKRAYIILFTVAITAFLVVDAIIEPLLQNMLHNVFILLAIKAIIGLLIKPLESILEKYLVTKTRKKQIKIIG